MSFFNFTNYKFNLKNNPRVMGILNLTPDSFSDGGKWNSFEKAIARTEEIEQEGADFLDIGAQSTRPGYEAVSADEEWNRLEKIIKVIKNRVKIPVSVDTFYPEIAEKAAYYGVDIINDITGCENNRMFEIAKTYNCGIIINHNYETLDIKSFFEKKLSQATSYNIKPCQICFDPGIGFNKTRVQDGYIIKNLQKFKLPHNPILVGVSRKRIVGECCGNPPPCERMPGTIAANTIAVLNGADIVRVHDVKESVQALKVTKFINSVDAV